MDASIDETPPRESDRAAASRQGIRQPQRFSELARPSIKLESEWLGESGGVGIQSYELGVGIPLYPVFGPPPPIFRVGFSQANLTNRGSHDLPGSLYDGSLGVSWVRRLNEKWTTRLFASTAFAGDGQNVSSDAWQFRGGIFGIYQQSPDWTWTIGAIALGRNDLPIVPAFGVVYEPTDAFKASLILPRPKVSFRMIDDASWQHWAYVAGGFSGGTWAFERSQGEDDQLTYRDWRIVLGWESIPSSEAGLPFQRRRFALEAGYSFSRRFEFDSEASEVDLSDTILVSGTVQF